jgi:hypothetical protein
MSEIRELTYRNRSGAYPIGSGGHMSDGRHISDNYDIGGSFPWYQELEPESSPEEAVAAAQQWAEAYRKRDPYGNMAHVHGVIKDPKGWRGVVNYFHSNT